MSFKKITYRRSFRKIAAYCLLIFISIMISQNTALHKTSHYSSLYIDSSAVENGDLIFRKGRSFVSRLVLYADGETIYSHVGIIIRRGDTIDVIHAVPDESSDGTDRIIREPAGEFLSRAKTESYAVGSVDCDNFIKTAAALSAEELESKHLLFDPDFDLNTDDKVYCTELIWKVYKSRGFDIVGGRFDTLKTIFHSGEFILPSSLFKNKAVNIKYTYN